MHPDRAFRLDDENAMLAFADATGFAHIFAATAAGPMVAHAPVVREGAAVRFHVSRANRLAAYLDDARVLVSVGGAEGYVSPNWYARGGDQVPTWNYVAVEIEGVARALPEAALVAQLDTLAARHEPRVNPALPWTRDKMDDAVFRRMLGAIRGFEVPAEVIRGTRKLSQNKRDADRAGVIAGLRAAGNDALAEAMMMRAAEAA